MICSATTSGPGPRRMAWPDGCSAPAAVMRTRSGGSRGASSIQATPEGVCLIRDGRAREAGDGRRAPARRAGAGGDRRVLRPASASSSRCPSICRRRLTSSGACWRRPGASPSARPARMRGSPSASAIRARCAPSALRSGRNPVPLIVPCHRVWRTDGGLGGYLFGGELKRRLARAGALHARPRGLHSTRIVCRVGCHRPPPCARAPRGLRVGRGRALGRLSALQDMQAVERRVSARPSRPLPCFLPSAARLAGLDWAALEARSTSGGMRGRRRS